ncbi:MAG: hypothetical protein Kow0098_26930 [Ignavibacteriaceae bacterium]
MKRFTLIIFLAILTSGCEERVIPDPVTDFQKEMLSYLPADTDFLIYINLDNLRSSKIWDKFFRESVAAYSRQEWLMDFETRTGVGLRTGVSDLFMASGWNQNNSFAIRFTTNFARIAEYFQTSFDRAGDPGKRIYKLKDDSPARFYFPNDSLLLIFKNHEVLDGLISGTAHNLADDPDFIKIVEAVTVKDQYWIATDQSSYASAFFNALFPGEEDKQKLLTLINNISLSADISDGAIIYSTWDCKTDEHASKFSTLVRSAIALNLIGKREPGLAGILDKIDISRYGKEVFISISLTENDISRLRDVFKDNKPWKNL